MRLYKSHFFWYTCTKETGAAATGKQEVFAHEIKLYLHWLLFAVRKNR